MRRLGTRLAALALAAAVLVALPVIWIEGMCRAAAGPPREPAAPLVTDEGYARRESDSYLSFPEWYIVYAYQDLAAVLRRGNESEFAWGRQIAGFWRSLCSVNRIVSARGGAGVDTKVMLYTIGWSFTVEMAAKGVYETTVGRLFEWLRGDGKTAEDEFIARDLATYAIFLRQTPWYEYPFGMQLAAFWWETPFRVTPRALERRAVVTAEYGMKSGYATLIGLGSAATLGASAQEIHTVVASLTRADVAGDSRITMVRDLGRGRTLIRTPRYRAYTDVLVQLSRRGRDVIEIAGNRRILVTVLAPPATLPDVPGVAALFEAPVQFRDDWRRIGLDVAVPQLAAAIRTLERAGVVIEHVYDY